MGYLEQIMGDSEHIVYRTHQHVIVLLQRVIASLFAFAVLLALGLAVLVPPAGASGDRVRFTIGVIALGSLVMPIYLIISAWVRGLRGREFAWRIWRAALAGILILSVSLIMMLKPDLKPVGWIAVVVAVMPLYEAIRTFLDWLNERYVITNRRVMEIRGVINKQVSDSALEKVNDVQMTQSFLGRMLRYGTVRIITGSDIGVNIFHRISNPVRFKREMLNAKEQFHARTTPDEPHEEAAPAGVSPVGDADIPDLLVELDELRQKGILSEEEFQTKKKDLLERL